MQRAAKNYFQTQVTTTSQGDLVVMLFDGAIKFLTQAKVHLAANDMAQKGIAISKALDVINELDSSLNMEKGGELANNLHGLYIFCTNQMVLANLKKDPERIDHVLKVLMGLRSAYAEIASLPEAQAAAQEAAANMHASAILPPRAQAGLSPSGAATPVPGAGMRVRAMYAQAAQTLAEEEQASAPSALETALSPAPFEQLQAAPRESPDPASHQEQVPPASQADTGLPFNQGFGAPGGFARRSAGAEIYRRLSGE